MKASARMWTYTRIFAMYIDTYKFYYIWYWNLVVNDRGKKFLTYFIDNANNSTYSMPNNHVNIKQLPGKASLHRLAVLWTMLSNVVYQLDVTSISWRIRTYYVLWLQYDFRLYFIFVIWTKGSTTKEC